MRLTLAGEYAIRSMLFLAEQTDDRRVQIAEISSSCGIPENFLRNIILKLSKSQLIMTHRGAGGGVRLHRPATEITLLDVIEAVEGKLSLNHCLVSGQEFCGRADWCSVHLVWSKAQRKLIDELVKTSIQNLVEENRVNFKNSLLMHSNAQN